MNETTKLRTWDEPVLEATAFQMAKCRHCGGVILILQAQDGSEFALAHIGKNPNEVMEWMADSFEGHLQ